MVKFKSLIFRVIHLKGTLRMSLLFIFSLFLMPRAFSSEWNDSFSDSSDRFSSTLVWNTNRGELHPPIQVANYSDGSIKNKNLYLGDGRHGDFIPSRYAEFSSGGDISGQIIRLDTAVYSSLEVTSFYLQSGWTLQPVGSQPLYIRSFGAVTIDGNIDCSGANGSAQNANPSVVSPGGVGRCGGGSGGAGASSSVLAQMGNSGGVTIPNGVSAGVDGPSAGGGSSSPAAGGGGGGAYASSRGVGFDATNGQSAGAGQAGGMAADHAFDYIGGGFGGGGGGYYNSGSSAQNASGGGGGGGGGLIWIIANDDIWINGNIWARGGQGGTGSSLAGGGGGGGGGSIAIMSAGEVRLGGGVVSAEGGAGGGVSGHLGGDGSAGRTWLVGTSGFAIGGPPYEVPTSGLSQVGQVRYQTGIFYAISNEKYLNATLPLLEQYSISSLLPGASSVSLKIASHSKTGETPSWQEVAQLPFSMESYYQYQIALTSTSSSSPARVSSIQLLLSGEKINEFSFYAGCGRTGMQQPLNSDRKFMICFLLCMMMPFLAVSFLSRMSLNRKSDLKGHVGLS